MIGKRLSHYRILAPLGSGGMGDVYRARDEHLDRDVALKLLPPGSLRDNVARQRLRREALALSRCTNPHIAAVLDFDSEQGIDFLAMEMVEGETLADRLREGPLDPAGLLSIADQIADALETAHEQGIVHRDLKPSNVILTPKGLLKVLDFGLAKLTHPTAPAGAEERLTESGTVPGTLPYLPPEQVHGEAVDARSDLYALGVLLYEAATGMRPFRERMPAGLIYQILNETPPSPAVLNPRIPPDLARIILRCLEKDPARRYPGATAFRDALREVRVPAGAASGSGGAPPPADRTRPGGGSAGRPRVSVRTALLLAGVLVAGTLAALSLGRFRRPPPVSDSVLAVFEFRDLSPTPDPLFAPGVASLVHMGLTEGEACRVLSPELILDLRRRLFGSGRGAVREEEALDIARRAGATLLLAGDLGKTSSGYFLAWRLVDVRRGEILEGRRCSAEDLMALSDRAIADVLPILARFCGGSDPDLPAPVADLTTTSPEAWRHYTAGNAARIEARMGPALAELERAVAIDSTFALAHIAISRLDWNAVPDSVRVAAAERAWTHRSRLSVRDRLLLEAQRHVVQRRHTDAVATYRETLARWPDDREALTQLGVELLVAACLSEAAEVLRRAVALYPDDPYIRGALVSALRYGNHLEEALSESREAVSRFPESPNAWDDLGKVRLALGQPDSAARAYERALRLDPSYVDSRQGLAAVAYARGDLDGAIELLEKLAEASGLTDQQRWFVTSSYGIYMPSLMMLYAEAGRIGEAERLMERVGKLRTGRRDRFLHVYLWLDLYSEARSAIRKLGRGEEFPDAPYLDEVWALAGMDSARAAHAALEASRPRYRSASCWWDSQFPRLSALCSLAGSSPEEAVRTIQEARFWCGGNGLFDVLDRRILARAHRMAGRRDQAVREWKELLRFHGGHALAHYELGRLYEEASDRTHAEEEYRRFLQAWSRADTRLPQLRDARARLQALHAAGS